jgi:lysophospholipase L1-like esterase
MKKVILIILAVVFVAGAIFSPAQAKSKNRLRNTPVYYLSLGTSLAAGVQADPLTGESVVTDVSYPSKLAELLGQDIRKLRHENIGCPGETSQSIIYGGKCEYPHGSQLDQAVHFLKAHGKFTGLITIDLGANDVLQCVDGIEINIGCLDEVLNQLAIDLAYVLETLHEAAPNVPIVGMNYYNPFLVYWFQDPSIAQPTVGLQFWINTVIGGVYAANGFPVANVADAFMSYDLVTDVNTNLVPDSVELLCAWTWMCSFLNIHANETGYEVIADAFYSVLPEIPVSKPPRRRIK